MTSEMNGGGFIVSSFEETSGLFQTIARNQFNVKTIALAEKDRLDQEFRLLKARHTALSFARSSSDDVQAFFHEASKDYDSDLRNPYWAFAHDILKFILTKFIAEHFHNTRTIRVFDAGAGTGNWFRFVLGLNIGIRGIMFDMNASMLKIAKAKFRRADNSMHIIEGNLEVSSDFPYKRSNLVLCMHNVIGLARSTDLVLRNLFAYLEDDGIAFIMAMNKYHAFNFLRQFGGNAEVLRVVRDGTVKFKDDMPEMFCYTPEEFKRILCDAGFDVVTVLGFPVTVYPSVQDTKLLRKDTSILQLKNPKARLELLALEKRLCLYPELAYRGGSSLIAVCKKNTSTLY